MHLQFGNLNAINAMWQSSEAGIVRSTNSAMNIFCLAKFQSLDGWARANVLSEGKDRLLANVARNVAFA